jgi:hypothetical protein
VSGPAAVSFSPADAASTSATFNAAGTYVLRLTGSDGQLSSADDVTVTIIEDVVENQAPTASAGPDQTAALTGSTVQVALNGSAGDDGQPAGSTLTTTWSRTSGPAPVVFANPNSPATSATFTEAGTYVLRLTASDGELSASDEATITVDAVSPGGTPAVFPAIHDAYTENGSNFNSSLLRVESSSRKRIAYLQFDTRSAGTATGAALKITQSEDVSSGSMTLRLYAAESNGWTESGITGSNAPAKGDELAVFTGDISSGEVVTFDLSAHVGAPAVYSFILEADASTLDVSFASAENSSTTRRPSLTAMVGTAGAAATGALQAQDPGGFTTMRAAIQRDSSGTIRLTAANGTPGYIYAVQISTDLVEWFPMELIQADATGAVTFEDPAPPQGSAFYRLTEP